MNGTHYRLLFPKDYISAPFLRGQDVTLTIQSIEHEELQTQGGPEVRAVMRFVELEERYGRDKTKRTRKLCLNVTNAEAIAGLYGNEIEGWYGQRVTLFPTTTRFGRETVDCVRVRPQVPASDLDTDAAE